MRLLLSIVLLFSLNLWDQAHSAELKIPALTSPVMDLAGFLNEAERQNLSELAYEINANNGPQITILTVPNMQGNVIEEFSIRVADKWKLGTKERDNGLLVVIAKAERMMRIEVGQGLEGDLTDYDTAKYTRNIFPEYFKRGEFHAGLRLFMEDVAARFNIKLSNTQNQIVRRAPRRSTGGMGDMVLPVIIGVLVFGSLLFRRRPVARGLFTGIGFSAFSGIMGFPMMMILGVFIFGLLLGLIGIGNFLGAMVMSGGRRGGGFGGGGGGWSGGGGGFSGGGSSGSW